MGITPADPPPPLPGPPSCWGSPFSSLPPGTPRPPWQRWHPWTAWPPGTPRPSRSSRPRRSEYGGPPGGADPHGGSRNLLTPCSFSCLQNFAPQMSYGYDEKAGGMAVPGPMVSTGVAWVPTEGTFGTRGGGVKPGEASRAGGAEDAAERWEVGGMGSGVSPGGDGDRDGVVMG